MKRVLLNSLLLLASFVGLAQEPFEYVDSLNINNLCASVMVHGDLWASPNSTRAICRYATKTKRAIGERASVWMSGYDDAGMLHIAAHTYVQAGVDYWPGPLGAGATPITYEESSRWAKVWKVSRADVAMHKLRTERTISNTPVSILEWPGRNSDYAIGADGAALTVSDDMAPFADLNGNGKYEPLMGEYPSFEGEQAMWTVFNDNGPTHDLTKGRALGVQVKLLVYGYKRGTLIDDVMYYKYSISNRSTNNYSNFRIAFWDWVTIGSYPEALGVVLDSARRMEIVYDQTYLDGSPGPAWFTWLDTCIRAVTFIKMPGDVSGALKPMASMVNYRFDPSYIGVPTEDVQFDHYMRGRTRLGAPQMVDSVPNNFWSKLRTDTTYDPQLCYRLIPKQTGSIVLAGSSFYLPAGSGTTFTMALLVRRNGGICPDLDIDGIRAVCDTAWQVYHNPLVETNDVSEVLQKGGCKLYPNPAGDEVTVVLTDGAIGGQVHWQVCSVDGSAVTNGIDTNDELHISTTSLPRGVYMLRVHTATAVYNTVFMKQ